jgi:hypothetical protein
VRKGVAGIGKGVMKDIVSKREERIVMVEVEDRG